MVTIQEQVMMARAHYLPIFKDYTESKAVCVTSDALGVCLFRSRNQIKPSFNLGTHLPSGQSSQRSNELAIAIVTW